ncbi:MAG TPA: MarR family transcriptional regulator [Actinomycetota bacterium]
MSQQAISGLLIEAFRSLESEIGPALEDRGAFELTPAQARALLLVDRTGTRLTELARRAGVTKQAMMQLVDDLQTTGCVRRTPDPEDSRAKVVRLTAKGLRQRARARKAIQAVESRLKRQLGPRRFEVFRTTLEELVEPAE